MNRASLLGHYALTLYRSLTRHRLYAALNVLGLAVGIAVFLVLWLDVRFETSFEAWVPHAATIDEVQTTAPALKLTASTTMGGMLEELRADYPQILGVRVWDNQATVLRGGEVRAEQVEVVDPTFFRVFDLPLKAGDKATALANPDNVILTQAMARKYLAPGPLLGQSVTLAFNGETRAYRVAGVLKDLPKNTALKLDFLVPITPAMSGADPSWRHWGSLHLVTYLRFPDPAAASAFSPNLNPFVDRHGLKDLGPVAHKVMGLRLEPLPVLHLLNPKDAAVIAALAAVGVLTLLLAAINYVNLATARAALRAREVAVRKVMGGTGRMLAFQFIAESVLTVCFSALIGLALCELAIPLVNAAGGLSLKLNYGGASGLLLVVALVVLVVGVGAGAYPALILSRFQPAAVLAASRTPGGGRGAGRVREILVLMQFAIAITFMIATAVIVAQTRFVRHADRGYRRDGLIVVNSFNDSEVTAAQRLSLLNAWRGQPGVVSVTAGDMAPGDVGGTDVDYVKRAGTPGHGPNIYVVWTRPDFFTTYGARLITGRWLDLQHGGDDAKPDPKQPTGAAPPAPAGTLAVRNILINRMAVRALGFRNPADTIGKMVEEETDNGYRPMTIVGVVDDIRFRTPRRPVPPTVYLMRTADFDFEIAGVRYAGGDPRQTLKAMAGAWRLIAPQVPFQAKTADQNLVPYYRADDQHGRLFSLGAILAVGLGCVGLYGLATFATTQRVREIGIRKTLGASTTDILRLMVGQFLRPVILANLVAWPLAWLAMRSWLAGFDERIALSPLYFLAATALTFLIAVATVAGQAWGVARSEPAKALRHE